MYFYGSIVHPVVQVIADELNNASRPLLLVGGGAKEAKYLIKEIVENYNIPVVCSPAAADIYGTANNLSIGTVGSIGGSRAGNFALQNCDYLLVIGSKLCSQLTGMKSNFARDAKIIVVDIDKNEFTKDGIRIDRSVVCGAKDFLSEVINCRPKAHDKITN